MRENRMQGMDAIKSPEFLSEDPVLLLILTEGRILIFSYGFPGLNRVLRKEV
ncbi:MAG: hypothetical protein ACFFE4_22935 [Candidatus Thorarchaeota archaeon]